MTTKKVNGQLHAYRLRRRLSPCEVHLFHARSDILLTDRRGPEIESWFGVEDGTDPAIDNDWSFLPFMALADGIHAYVSVMSQNPPAKLLKLDRGLLLFHTPSKGDSI